tara:strand:- start:12 stop:374 length:363 start_codon:yes stop_codon:yes gene_type:complete
MHSGLIQSFDHLPHPTPYIQHRATLGMVSQSINILGKERHIPTVQEGSVGLVLMIGLFVPHGSGFGTLKVMFDDFIFRALATMRAMRQEAVPGMTTLSAILEEGRPARRTGIRLILQWLS